MTQAAWVPSRETRWTAAAFIASLLGVMFGGSVLIEKLATDPAYAASPLHQDLWRAGHAHAAIFLILGLVILPWIDVAALGARLRWFVRIAVSSASITFPLAFFLAAPTADVAEAGPALLILWPGGALLAAGLLVLTWGLLRAQD